MTDKEFEELRELFIQRMTVGKGEDRRKKEYNRAIFFKYDWEGGDGEYHQCFTDITMEMVLDKFDLAVKDMKRLKKENK